MKSNDIVHILQNTPIPVEFAGLRGDTFQMQQQGWEIVVEWHRMEMHDGYEFSLTGKHRGLNLYFYSGRTMFDRGMVHHQLQQGFVDFAKCLKMPVRIAHCAENMIMSMVGQQTSTFMSVDFSQPIMNNVQRKDINLADLVPFRGYNNVNEILVEDKEIWTVQKELDRILAEQKPYQAELREKRRKRMENKGSETNFNENPNGDIKLQLVGI